MAQRDADAPETPELPPPSSPTSSAEHGHGFGVYKSGQGYWTRVCTAIGLSLLLLSACAWLIGQCKSIDIPVHEWVLVLESTSQDPKVGMKLQFLPDATPPAPIATGSVREIGSSAGRKTVTVDSVTFLGEASSLKTAKNLTAEGSPFTAHVASVEGIPSFPLIYIEASAGGALFVVGAALIFWFVGRRHRSVDFLIATDAEMKKVNWSSRKTIMDSTWMVVLASVLIALLIYIIDIIFQWLFVLIGVLDR